MQANSYKIYIFSIYVHNVPKVLEDEIRKCGIFDERTKKGYARKAVQTKELDDLNLQLMYVLKHLCKHRDLLKKITDSGGEAVLYITVSCSDDNKITFSRDMLSLIGECGLTLGVD